MHDQSTDNTTVKRISVLATLRQLIPPRALRFYEALRIAELQANKLLELFDITEAPITEDLVAGLAHIKVHYRDLPTSGLTYWDGHNWIIGINSTEPMTRQRFTLMHEFKHIIDHGRTDGLYVGTESSSGQRQSEQAADFFAGCLLMPRRLVKRAYGQQVQRPTELGQLFEVSARAVEVRLAQLGLSTPTKRCAPLTISSHDRRNAN